VEELKTISPLPILDAIPEVDAEIRRRNLKRVRILGTQTVMETALSRAAGLLPQRRPAGRQVGSLAGDPKAVLTDRRGHDRRDAEEQMVLQTLCWREPDSKLRFRVKMRFRDALRAGGKAAKTGLRRSKAR